MILHFSELQTSISETNLLQDKKLSSFVWKIEKSEKFNLETGI